MEPVQPRYLMLALEVDYRPPVGFFIQSRRKTRLLRDLKTLAQTLRRKSEVHDASIFKVLIVPPGRGAFPKKRPHVKVAQFDIVMLIEFTSLEAAYRFKDMPRW